MMYVVKGNGPEKRKKQEPTNMIYNAQKFDCTVILRYLHDYYLKCDHITMQSNFCIDAKLISKTFRLNSNRDAVNPLDEKHILFNLLVTLTFSLTAFQQ